MFGTRISITRSPAAGPEEYQNPKFGEEALVGVTVPLSEQVGVGLKQNACSAVDMAAAEAEKDQRRPAAAAMLVQIAFVDRIMAGLSKSVCVRHGLITAKRRASFMPDVQRF